MAWSRSELIETGRSVDGPALQEWAGHILNTATQDLGKLKHRPIFEILLREIPAQREKLTVMERAMGADKPPAWVSAAKHDETHESALTWWNEARDIAKAAFGSERDKLVRFRYGMKVGRSVPRLLQEIELILPAVREFAAELAVWGLDHAFSQKGEDLLAALRDSEKNLEFFRRNLPSQWADVYAGRAILYDTLRRIVRLARAEFRDLSEANARYSFDGLRRKKSAPAAGAARPAPVAAAAR